MWFLYGLSGRLEKVLKYKTAWILATALKQGELPEAIPLWPGDRVEYLLPGKMGHGLLRMLRQRSGRIATVRLAQDIYFAKRGSNQVGDRFIEESLLKHHKLLTEHEEIEVGEGLIQAIRETTRSVYTVLDAPFVADPDPRRPIKTDVLQDDDDSGVSDDEVEFCRCADPDYYGDDSWDRSCTMPFRKHEVTPGWGKVPTFGSCVENPRGKGGAFGFLVGNDGLGLVPREGYLLGYMRCTWKVVEIRVPDIDGEYRFSEIRRAAQTSDVIDCLPVALCEPFKVRVITRGSAVPYHLCRAYQPMIHHRMASVEPFHLTMGPLETIHLERLLAKASRFDRTHGGFWVSGDYESATDNLHPDLSEHCMDVICEELSIPFEDRIILQKALTGHEIGWVGQDENRYSARQNWGQLMGSPVSFPVLCLVNAAITKCWYERVFGRKFRLSELPMLVNGDDILFWCPGKDEYAYWKEMVTSAGLKPSLGKNYCSDEYLVINSEISRIKKCIDWFGSEQWILVERLPSLNFGLLFGTTKSGSSHHMEKTVYGSHDLQRDSLRMRAHDWIAGYPEDQDLLMSVFISYWKDLLHSVPKEMSWWVHPKFGGLGLPVTRNVEITGRQRKLAAYLWTTGDSLKGLGQPIPEFTDAYMRDWSSALREVGCVVERGGKFSTESFRTLKYYMGLGFDPTDPQGYSALLKVFNKYWKSSKSHWSKELSFRKCVAGPDREMGGRNRLGLSY